MNLKSIRDNLLFLALFLFAGFADRAEEPLDFKTRPAVDLFSLHPGVYFARQGNYFEAITEFRRSAHEDPKNAGMYHLAAGDAYFFSGSYSAARRMYSVAPKKAESDLRELDMLYREKKLSVSDLQTFLKNDPAANADFFRLESARALAARGSYEKSKILLSLAPFTDLQYEQRRLALLSLMQQRPRYHSSGRLLFAVIPGGGYAALGDAPRAMLSFATVGLLSAVSVVSFSSGMDVLGLISGVFAARYYYDSIRLSFSLREEQNHLFREEYNRTLLSVSGGDIYFSRHVDFISTVQR